MARIQGLFAAVLVCAASTFAQTGFINTIAGTDPFYRIQNGPALNAPLGRLQSVAIDRSSGAVYVADADNNIVVRLDSNGQLQVVAGTGQCVFSGDGGPGANAALCDPAGLAFDPTNNFLYIADLINYRIRRLVTTTGTITTVAGTGTPDFSGDGGSALSAKLLFPTILALNSQGSLFIADASRIRKLANGVITTVAGNGQTGFSGDGGPALSAAFGGSIGGIAADLFGNIYVSDYWNHRIRAFQENGSIRTVVGTGISGFGGDGGPAASALLNGPGGLTMDTPQNSLLIADIGNNRIRSVNAANAITTVAGTGISGFMGDGATALNAAFDGPVAVMTDAANAFFIADTKNLRLRKMQAGGNINTVAGNGQYFFFGDNGPATNAVMSFAAGVATDASGNVYVADGDNHRVRKITPAGTITTFAGTGLPGSAGDGGPATSAMLNVPFGLVFDSSGNLLIAEFRNHRVRKVTPAGTISTVAGSGAPGYGGDGGQAAAARLNNPTGVGVDQSGNILIADYGNSRIRMVTPTGIISTVAGNGQSPSSGDNGLATSAGMLPIDVSGAGSDVFYVADTNGRIRKVSGGIVTTLAQTNVQGVSTDATGNVVACTGFRVVKILATGVVSTLAGNGQPGFSGDAGPALNASIACRRAVFDSQGNLVIGDGPNARVRKVTYTPIPSVTVSPASLNFTMIAGVANPDPQKITLNSSPAGALWGAKASTSSGGGWLLGAPTGGTLPDTGIVFVNGLGLAPGTYQGSVTILTPQASPTSTVISVTLTVTQAAKPVLTIGPNLLGFETVAGGAAPSPQTILVGTGGGPSLTFTATATMVNGNNWLVVPSGSATATLGNPTSIPVTVNATGLAAGIYTGSVKVNSVTTGETATVGVKLLVTPNSPTILLSQTGLLFTSVQGSNLTFSQSIGIVNIGTGTLNWQASLPAGGNIFSVSPASGTSTNGGGPQRITLTANFNQLPAGSYSGFMTVAAPGASNSPQSVGVVVNILPATQKATAHVQPAGMILVASGAAPATQTFRVSFPSGGVGTTVNVQTRDGGNWLSASQQSFSTDTTVTLSASRGALASGVYLGVVALVFAGGIPTQDVYVLMIVPPASGASPQSKGLPAAAGCTPKQLLGVMSKLANNFSSQVGWPVNLEATVADDCGNLVSQATVQATFSNGDPPLQLIPLGDGTYSATWTPARSSAATTTVSVQASLAPLAPVTLSIPGQVATNSLAPPAIASRGVVSAASFEQGADVAPGSIIAIFGSNMASAATSAPSVPLPSALAGVKVSIGGNDAPLFFTNSTQANVQVPFNLPPNSRTQAVLRVTPTGSTQEQVAVPESISIGPAHPGIFLAGVANQGVIVNLQGSVVDAAHPARAGDTVVIYATGLGLTDQTVGTGLPSPSSPVASVTTPVTVTIGGKTAAVAFAGLTPTLVGLYQVNVIVPAGITPGDAVPVVLTQNGVPSGIVTMGIR